MYERDFKKLYNQNNVLIPEEVQILSAPCYLNLQEFFLLLKKQLQTLPARPQIPVVYSSC